MRCRSLSTLFVLLFAALVAWQMMQRSGIESALLLPASKLGETAKPSKMPQPKPLPAMVQEADDEESAPPATDAMTMFGAWFQRYQLAAPSSRTGLISEGETLAQQRADALYALIATDPEAALAVALPESQRHLLPASLLPLLEHRIAAHGDLALVASRVARGHSAPRSMWREARVGDAAFEAFVYGRRADQSTRYGVSLNGIELRGRMAVSDSAVQIIERSEVPLGVKLQPVTGFDQHQANSEAYADAQSAPIVVADGQYFPACCATYASALAARWQQQEAKAAISPFVQAASGGSSANQPVDIPLMPAQKARVEGAKNILVIVADFSDSPGRPTDFAYYAAYPITEAYARNRILTEGGSWFNDASYGKLTLGGVDVTPVVRVAGTLKNYSATGNHTGLKAAAIAAAATAGYDVANYDRTVLVFENSDHFFRPTTSNPFYWSGLADIGGDFVWINGWFDLETVLHELMHTMGLPHANLWQVPSRAAPFNSSGHSDEYGDKFDIMGDTVTQAGINQDVPNPWFLRTLGWLPPTAVETVQSSGTYRVYRFDHRNANLTSPLALRVPRTQSTDYWLSYRFKPGADLATGAYVIWGYHKLQPSDLIDVDTPGTNVWDAPLNIGNTLNDTTAGVSLSVLGQGGASPDEYLDVQVNYSTRLAFSQPSYYVDEAAGSATVTVERLSNSTGVVTVNYTTLNGSATAPADYSASKGTLVWTDGDSSPRNIVIPVKADVLAEGGGARVDNFTVRLSNAVGAVLPSGIDAKVLLHEPGATDASFAPPFLTNAVKAIVTQPEDLSIVGGSFDLSTGSGVASAGLARLCSDGRFDNDYDQGAGPDELPLTAMQSQVDGRILVAGNFAAIRGIARNHIARLNVDGSLDTSFDAGLGPDAAVRCLVVQPDGSIVVGGDFTTWNSEARPGLVRLLSNGSLDSAFPAFSTVVESVSGLLTVNALALVPAPSEPHFALFVGGLFQRSPTATAFHSGIVRLTAAGTLDAAFAPLQGAHDYGATNSLRQVSSIAVQSDGKVLVGGQFTAFNGVKAGHMVRLLANGSNDASFVTATKGAFTSYKATDYCDIVSLWPRNDGKIIAAGTFAKASGVVQNGAACYLANGVLDQLFKVSIGGASGVNAMSLLPDNRILLGLNGSGSNAVRRVFPGLTAQPGIITFRQPATSGVEGSAIAVVVRRVGGSSGAVSVNYSTVPGTANAGTDYTTRTGTLSWANGDAAPKVIQLATASDSEVEDSEMLSVQLGIPMGGAQLGSLARCSVTLLDGAVSNYPTVQFTTTSSSVSEGASAGIEMEVTLSAPTTTTVTVPLSFSGSAVVGDDYHRSTEQLDFAAGETSKSIVIVPRDDFIIDPTTLDVMITLETPFNGAILGPQTQHTVTLLDDEQRAAIQTQPTPQIAALNQPTTLSVVASGTPPPSYQWKKNKISISGATSADYTIPSTQLSNACSYTVTVSNLDTSVTSKAIELAVADQSSIVRPLNNLASTKLSVASAGKGMIYRWQRNGVDMTDSSRFKGSATKVLTMSKLTSSDTAVYRCRISSSVGAAQVYGLTTDLGVIDTIPAIDSITALPSAAIGVAYDSPAVFIPVDPSPSRHPTSYSAIGLPPGLKVDTATGQITGTPMVALTTATSYDVTLNAINFKGTATLVVPMMVAPLPAEIIGSYSGQIARDNSLNNFLGGRLHFDVTKSSSLTGSLKLGASSYAFTGAVHREAGNPQAFADFIVTRSSKTPARVRFTIDPATSRLMNASVSDNSAPSTLAAVTGWKEVFSATATTNVFDGYYTFGAFVPADHMGFYNTPQGTSYGSFTVGIDGSFTLSGRLADGTSFTQAGTLGPLGEMAIYELLYTNTGSLLGQLSITPGTAPDYDDNLLTGSINWSRKLQTTNTLIYKAGYYWSGGEAPYDMPVLGGRYIDPAELSGSGIVMNLPDRDFNARLMFPSTTGEYIPSTLSTSVLQRVMTGGALAQPIISPNPHNLSLTISPATGAFAGSLSIIKAPPGSSVEVTRTSDFEGMIINNGTRLYGVGFFLMPMWNVVYTPTNTKVFSNPVVFEGN